MLRVMSSPAGQAGHSEAAEAGDAKCHVDCSVEYRRLLLTALLEGPYLSIILHAISARSLTRDSSSSKKPEAGFDEWIDSGYAGLTKV